MPYTPFTLHTENGSGTVKPFSVCSVNASVSVLEPFSSNGFAFRSETVLEPFSLQCERKPFSETVLKRIGTSMFLKTRDIIYRAVTS